SQSQVAHYHYHNHNFRNFHKLRNPQHMESENGLARSQDAHGVKGRSWYHREAPPTTTNEAVGNGYGTSSSSRSSCEVPEADDRQKQGDGWWWTAGDRVHQSHVEGKAASYYSASSRPSMRRGASESEAGRDSSRAPGPPRTSATQIQGEPPNYYLFSSAAMPDPQDPLAALPPFSQDGGSEEEFQQYWDWHLKIRHLPDGWVERVAHPQVNNQKYWYQEATSSLVWEKPVDGAPTIEEFQRSPLQGSGQVWDLSPAEIKSVLRTGQAADYGIETAELARRACAEFENFMPRVLSWHDYQYLCFWFFGGKDSNGGDRNAKSTFFSADSGASRDLFADDAFFAASARLLQERLPLMHPINTTYFVWTFARAGVEAPNLMQAV
ncbi:unnamed protein product, partial [Polarella glacialis]